MKTLEHALGQEGAACLVVIVGAVALLLLISVSSWVVKAMEDASPAGVQRRAVAMHRKRIERNIAAIGEATRQAIQEAEKRNRQ